MSNKYFPVLFNDSRYSNRLPIGTDEVLNNFKHETLRQFYTDWYRPDLQALIVVGDIEVDNIEKMIKSKFSDLKMPANPRERTQYTIPLTGKNQFIALTDIEFPYTMVSVMIKNPELVVRTTADFREKLKRDLFNEMLGNRYTELANQADAAFMQGGADLSPFLAGLDVYSASLIAKPGKLENGFKAIWREAERVKQFGFTQTELDRAKLSVLNSMESSFKEKDKTNSSKLANSYLKNFLQGQAIQGIEASYHLTQEQLPSIPLAEINEITKQYITEVNRDVLIMAPEKDKNTLPDEATVNKWFADIEGEQLTAYVDQVTDKPLVAVKPKAGKIISEKKIDELNVTELFMNNGVKVVLKPTEFKNDEIRYSATSPGGTSLYSDVDFESAANAADIIRSSGIGEFNPIQLPKVLSGKTVYVSPYINELTEGFNGFSTPKDFETALELIYLYCTSPRKDTAIYNNIISSSKSRLANQGDDPESVFYDTINAVTGNYNVRRTAPSVAKIEQINLDRAFAIYKERFADASDFTFTFVGNIDVTKIKPLLEQWLGALPSTKRKENFRDLGIQIPEGLIEKKVYKGTEQKAAVKMVFSGDYVYNQQNNIQLDALGDILKIKLIERLRELESGVYTPREETSYWKFPKNKYSFNISFGCAPANVENLISATMEEIKKIKDNGVQIADLQKVIAESTRLRETQMKDNRYWIRYLNSCYTNNTDPKEILSYNKLLNELTTQGLTAVANKYLSGDNILKFVLLPEDVN